MIMMPEDEIYPKWEGEGESEDKDPELHNLIVDILHDTFVEGHWDLIQTKKRKKEEMCLPLALGGEEEEPKKKKADNKEKEKKDSSKLWTRFDDMEKNIGGMVGGIVNTLESIFHEKYGHRIGAVEDRIGAVEEVCKLLQERILERSFSKDVNSKIEKDQEFTSPLRANLIKQFDKESEEKKKKKKKKEEEKKKKKKKEEEKKKKEEEKKKKEAEEMKKKEAEEKKKKEAEEKKKKEAEEKKKEEEKKKKEEEKKKKEAEEMKKKEAEEKKKKYDEQDKMKEAEGMKMKEPVKIKIEGAVENRKTSEENQKEKEEDESVFIITDQVREEEDKLLSESDGFSNEEDRIRSARLGKAIDAMNNGLDDVDGVPARKTPPQPYPNIGNEGLTCMLRGLVPSPAIYDPTKAVDPIKWDALLAHLKPHK